VATRRTGGARGGRRSSGGSDLGGRIAYGAPALVLAIVLVVQGGWVLTVGLFVLGFACLAELFRMFHFANPSPLAGLIGLAGLLVAAQLGSLETVALALAACVPLTFLLCAAQVRHSGAPGVAVTLLGLVWIGFAFAHAVLLRDLPHGGGIIAGVLVGTFVGDAAAYFGGRAFGRRPLAPRISPNKTLEGLLCGIAGGTLAVWFTGLYQDWLGGTQALLLGLAVTVAAPVGDLFESYLKRDAGAKDTGRLFGAHGGALDRLDAVLFTAVVGYWVWRAML
jgi:phosphatidate cytidylyltransferase